MDDLGCAGCAVNHVLACLSEGRRRWVVLCVTCSFFGLFALILHIFNNFTYVKFTFALFQGQIAACNNFLTCISKHALYCALHRSEFFGAFFGIWIAVFFRVLLLFTLLLRKYRLVIKQICLIVIYIHLYSGTVPITFVFFWGRGRQGITWNINESWNNQKFWNKKCHMHAISIQT